MSENDNSHAFLIVKLVLHRFSASIASYRAGDQLEICALLACVSPARIARLARILQQSRGEEWDNNWSISLLGGSW